MAIELPNPCDGVVQPSVATPAPESPQSPGPTEAQELVQAEQSVFVQRTVSQPVARAGRRLMMVDEEFFVDQDPPYGTAGTLSDFTDEVDSVYTPSWFYNKKQEEGFLTTGPDASFNREIIDPLRSGLALFWGYYFDPDNEFATYYFLNTLPDNNPSSYGLPVRANIDAGGARQNNRDLHLPCTERIQLQSDRTQIASLTNNYESFTSPNQATNRKRWWMLYLLGDRYDRFNTAIETDAAKNKYRQGLLPPSGSRYVDSVFDHPLPFHKREANFLNIPTFNVVEATLESRGFLTEAFGKGKITSEYQKPSIYRSFFEEKSLENLELTAIPANAGGTRCIPSDRVHKFPSDKVEMFETANSKLEGQSESFVRIKIATKQGQDNFIGQLLRNNKMDRHILDLISSTDVRYPETEEAFSQIMNDVIIVKGARRDFDLFTENDRAIRGRKTKTEDNFIQKIKDQSAFVGERIQNISQYPMGYFNHDKPLLLSFEDAITSQIFLSELQDHVSSRLLNRTFEEICLGKKAHSEIIAFHVEKADSATGEVIQDFYFSDSNEVLEIDFIDNQILKGKKYRYRVYAVNLVLATEYEYGNNTIDTEDFETASIAVASRVKYKIVETPYFEKVISVFDKPPMFPQVTVMPFQGVEDKIGFLLQDNGGEVLELPIKIQETDAASFEFMADAQDKNIDEKILYGSDDLPTEFQALCLSGDEEPHSYKDFSSAPTKIFTASGKTGFFMMDIEPNKYYYILFRTLEEDMISNPTEVFRFMMVSYENGIFLDFQTIELEKPKEKKMISFERNLKISPTFAQTSLNIQPESNSAQDRTVFKMSAPEIDLEHIGRPDGAPDDLWGKNLKLRLKSRSTGKEIDIKVSFKKEVVTFKNLDEQESAQAPGQQPVPEVCDD